MDGVSDVLDFENGEINKLIYKERGSMPVDPRRYALW